MAAIQTDHIKHREIEFCALNPKDEQAQRAMLLLADVEGVEHIRIVHRTRIHISYNIHHLSLQLIESALIEVGFHLENSLMNKIRRALYYYTEDIQRETLGICNEPNCTQSVFINRYEQLKHGCRDGKPDFWRKYL